VAERALRFGKDYSRFSDQPRQSRTCEKPVPSFNSQPAISPHRARMKSPATRSDYPKHAASKGIFPAAWHTKSSRVGSIHLRYRPRPAFKSHLHVHDCPSAFRARRTPTLPSIHTRTLPLSRSRESPDPSTLHNQQPHIGLDDRM
jgi:hypothetical protein